MAAEDGEHSRTPLQDRSNYPAAAKSSDAPQPKPQASDNDNNGTNGEAHEHEHEHEHDHTHEDNALFQVSVKLPGGNDMKIMVSSQEQVQDLRQSIVETPDTFQYTCFHLEHNGEKINDFVELSEVKDLKADSELTLVQDPYTEKEARMHVVRIRELIGASGDRADQLQGICAGLSLHDERFGQNQTVEEDKTALVGYQLEGRPPLDAILPRAQDSLPKTIKSLSVSQWNPPPHQLRQRGHLLYLLLTTNEGDQHHITASVSGFFLNKSSSNKFDPFPRPAPKNHSAHSLLSLISILSPSFDGTFVDLQKANGQKDLLTTFPFQNAIPANPWLVPASYAQNTQHQSDVTRSQEAYLLGGVDGAENLRDWNEEFQTTRELPRETLQDRVFRERLTSKLFADYNDAAAKGAVAVARGEVAPLNPTEGKDAQIFIYNNIFFSYGCDGVQTFASEGGDEAARVAVGKDVAGVKAVNQLDINGLFTPGTVVVDYLGRRIVAQSIVPGIFKQREPGEHQIDYGGVEGRDTVTENEAFVPVFEKLSKALRVKKHAVWDKEGKRHDLEGSVETKGLLGTDGRKYVLDLYRITPLDVAWSEEVEENDAQYGKYPHRMSVLRLELVEAFWRTKMQEYVKAEVEKKRASASDEKESASEEKDENAEKKDETPAEQDRIDISNFTFALNPDVCSGQVPQTNVEKSDYAEDEKNVRSVCAYLRDTVIPGLITELHDSDVGFPMDGQSLCQLLHKRGINLRYLGQLATLANEKGRRLEAFYVVALQEMVVRAFKHIVNGLLNHLPALFAPACISHLLNCFVGAELNSQPAPEIDEELRTFYADGDYSFEKMTPTELQKQIVEQVKLRYRYELPSGWSSEAKPLQLLREACLRLGLQLVAKEYDFGRGERPALNGVPTANGTEVAQTNGVNGTHHEETTNKKKKKKTREQSPPTATTTKAGTTFSPEDVLNIAPTVKDASPRSALAEEALEAGKISLAQGQKQLGQELVLESLSLHEQIYGILHPEVAKMYHSLSTIYYQTDEKEAAVELARKAVIVTERTLGVDSHDTILAYLNLSLFEHHVGNTKQALRYVRHALDVWKIVFGAHHPDSITTINNAAVMLQSMKEYPESRKWFEQCYAVCEELFGRQSANAATILFQLAQALALDGDPKAAVSKMRDAYNIFLAELGPEDRNTKEAENWLEQLTQNAVAIAKQAKDIQARRLRGIRYLPGMRAGTRLQPQSANSATPNAGTTTNNGHVRSPTGSVNLDSRSIDELLKFIEGDSGSPRGKSKKKSVNPKARGRKSATAAA
jgi:protein TIF31